MSDIAIDLRATNDESAAIAVSNTGVIYIVTQTITAEQLKVILSKYAHKAMYILGVRFIANTYQTTTKYQVCENVPFYVVDDGDNIIARDVLAGHWDPTNQANIFLLCYLKYPILIDGANGFRFQLFKSNPVGTGSLQPGNMISGNVIFGFED